MAEAVGYLEERGIETWVFGGWAEELRGLVLPRTHSDLDLLYPAEDFGAIDALLATGELEEITAKRFAHKRAFRFAEAMVETFLMAHDRRGWHTMFWDQVRHDWPMDVVDVLEGRRVVSADALRSYRDAYPQLRQGRATPRVARPLSMD
jgi:hypothetical protein